MAKIENETQTIDKWKKRRKNKNQQHHVNEFSGIVGLVSCFESTATDLIISMFLHIFLFFAVFVVFLFIFLISFRCSPHDTVFSYFCANNMNPNVTLFSMMLRRYVGGLLQYVLDIATDNTTLNQKVRRYREEKEKKNTFEPKEFRWLCRQ